MVVCAQHFAERGFWCGFCQNDSQVATRMTADLSTETRVLARHDSGVVEVSERFLQLYWIGNLGGRDAARLLGSFTSDPPPALDPLVRREGKMLFRARSEERRVGKEGRSR